MTCSDNGGQVGEERPSLCWEIGEGENATQFTLAFGYLGNEPNAVLFINDKPEIMAFIPKEVLGIAYHQGWSDLMEEDEPEFNDEEGDFQVFIDAGESNPLSSNE